MGLWRSKPRQRFGAGRRGSASSGRTGLSWDSRGLLLGVVYAIPAALAVLSDVSKGLALSVGVVPAAAVGLPPTRRARRFIAVLGVVIGVPIFVGSLVAPVPPVAVAFVVIVGLGAAWLAQRATRLGQVALTLGVPMVGVGLSYTDRAQAATLALIMIAGSLYAFAVSLLWPETVAPHPPAAAPPAPTLLYGLRLGLAGATAAAIGFALDFDHVGWAATAAMLVMRPAAEMQQLRSVGRLVSVTIGALAGITLARLEPSTAVYSLVSLVTVGAVAATNRSHWYITPAFTTFIVFLLLLQSNPNTAAARFGERLAETFLGVALAYILGVALPNLFGSLNRRTTSCHA